MIYLPDVDAMFLHIPKCGGTWLQTALTRCGVSITHPDPMPDAPSRHETLFDLYRSRRPSTRVFTFVRNPLHWYVSYWLYQSRLGWKQWRDVGHPLKELNQFCRPQSFSDFCKIAAVAAPSFVSRMYEWYCGPQNAGRENRGLVYILYLENAAKELAYVLNLWGMKVSGLEKVEPRNASEHDLSMSEIRAGWEHLDERVAQMRFGYD